MIVWAWKATNRNGRIPLHKLAEIEPSMYDADLGGPARMHPEAAINMTWFLHDAEAAGHFLWVKYSYRTLTKQREKYAAYVARNYAPPIVAKPGTSNHGYGLSDDLSWRLSCCIDWMHTHASEYGFRFDVPSENWHITYQGTGPYREGDMSPADRKRVAALEKTVSQLQNFVEGAMAQMQADRFHPAGRRVGRSVLRTEKKAPVPGETHQHDVELPGSTLTTGDPK